MVLVEVYFVLVRIIKSVFKPQNKDTQEKAREVVDVDEETEIDEEHVF